MSDFPSYSQLLDRNARRSLKDVILSFAHKRLVP